MDRHDVPGASPEDVAKAHMSDLAIASQHGVQFISYWFDPDAGGAFCLAKAPKRESLITYCDSWVRCATPSTPRR
jgi:hypothetical protein